MAYNWQYNVGYQQLFGHHGPAFTGSSASGWQPQPRSQGEEVHVPQQPQVFWKSLYLSLSLYISLSLSLSLSLIKARLPLTGLSR